MLVLALFFCSGATALIYEVLWSKYLTLMLGSTVQAQTVVLAVFMGGLALGNRLFGNRSTAIQSPVLVYGVLEMIIGVYAFFFSNLYQAGDAIFIAVGSKLVNIGFLLLLLKLLLSTLLLLLPTVLMGGTLPLLAAWIERQSGFDANARVGIFYAVNSLGAVTGAGLAGFALVQRYGMVSSLELTGLINVFIGLVGLVAGKRESLLGKRPPVSAPRAEAPGSTQAFPMRLGLLVAITGGISMGLEVLYSRAIALIVGGSLQAFALVLMSFILGIGLGSAAISSLRLARRNAVNSIYVLLLGAAAAVVVNVMFIESWTILYSQAKSGLAANVAGYYWHQVGVAIFSFIILGIPAAFLGAVVPLAIRLFENASTLGEQVGRLMTSNTIGAVLGVVITGFVLMPAAGLRGALTLAAFALFSLAAFLAFQRQQTRLMIAVIVLGAAGLIGIASTGQSWRQVLASGVYRLRNITVDTAWLRDRVANIRLLYYKDSADATVSVEQSGDPGGGGQIILRINGKTDATSRGDLSTQLLLAHLPMMANPDAKNAFVLGFGSGVTAGALLGHPLDRVTIAENCAPVLDAAYLFQEWNRGVLTNNRVRVLNDDARAVLKLRPDKYDIIISEPSNPWVAGIGSVFTQEFYQLAANRLADGGVMAQWFHKYEMNDTIVFMVVRTFASVFPHLEIWDPQDGDLILLGSKSAWPSNPAHYQKIFERPEPRRDLARCNLRNAVSMWARQVASQKTAFAIPGDGPIQSDEFPLLEYNAPLSFFLGSNSDGLYAYDERTLQYLIAEPAKLQVLRALPMPVVLEIFDYYRSANRDLHQYIASVEARLAGGNTPADPGGLIVFRPPNLYPEKPSLGTNASPYYAECLQSTFSALRDDSKWEESCGTIEKVLNNILAAKIRPTDFVPSYFAGMAARFAIGHGDYVRALRLLQLGFVFNIEDPQLLYLSRVMDRLAGPETWSKAGLPTKLF